MTELSVAPLASVILALVLAMDGYNKTKQTSELSSTSNNFLTTVIALGLFLVVAVVAILFKPTSAGAKMIFSAVSMILLVIALVVAWLNYVNNAGEPLGAQTLAIAIITAIPLLATIVTRETITLKLDL
jgi:energy-converting hydrogenase Eha subunit A